MPIVEARVVLSNKMGLHARPSTQIATTASRFSSDIHITKDDMVVDAKSVLELLMLAAEADHHLNGNRAQTLLAEAHAIFERNDVPHSKRFPRLQTLSQVFAAR